ncbi:MAG: hypothetical protein A2312_04935 [Candidatus Staskawiczbacteria bacterium RIFOXYB2_FULL_32_9]|uniref:Uncharacterized protein n=1 Tax=Candidatus Staskawiczbacteria bacterium RIFOXYD1_FULL_32_13 TaxID=1802234 RepID=A0A1G2JMY9_9BACT|nr:MAG: hypothetical protein A2256_02880 [Candidatus Staskawiczbacteria bacterium RIFOXYA2_FULL_32_7]OGZ78526.1 MAG: hypothetical protein A2360_00030 [Candidatus Staskawiczbacteria bacterium RIFOXYB1_FULL_32_11]OGZ83829.1 MAG: hypothetical protein A2312_04935 [Candidatus Staskawiczbacteria bacterium RIFOXYB2_FULL_32_9]OGZ87608.1 MAG: hypothetical protein A2561_04030 [Candidatus Staskawiczbacteria bacterium RIFOXYD1_FULL_32_13]
MNLVQQTKSQDLLLLKGSERIGNSPKKDLPKLGGFLQKPRPSAFVVQTKSRDEGITANIGNLAEHDYRWPNSHLAQHTM